MKTTLRRCFQHNFGGIVAVLLSILILQNWFALGVALTIASAFMLLTNIVFELLYGVMFTGSELDAFLSANSVGRAVCKCSHWFTDLFPPELLNLPLRVQVVVLVGLLVAVLFPAFYFVYLAVATVAGVCWFES